MKSGIRKIYYVDDDIEDIEIFTAAVQKMEEDHTVKVNLKVYSEGLKLLNDLKEIEPDKGLLFLDINMPLKNGFEILAEIRGYAEFNNLPVIMYSTSSDSKSISISQELGANLYAVKPHSMAGITNLIKHVMEMKWSNLKFHCVKFVV